MCNKLYAYDYGTASCLITFMDAFVKSYMNICYNDKCFDMDMSPQLFYLWCWLAIIAFAWLNGLIH